MPIYGRKHTRNLYITAHIDHGKSTLAGRIIGKTDLLTEREMQGQILDTTELERERGIAVRSQAARMAYRAADGEEHVFDLVDTPGHIDFNYEVSRAFTARSGVALMVDTSQGIEAQMLANVYMASDRDLEVILVTDKVDLPSAEPDKVTAEIEDVIGIGVEPALRISAKTGPDVNQVLEAIVRQLPPPGGDGRALLQALIFGSLYNSYRGVIVFLRVKNGTVQEGDRVHMMATGAEMDVVGIGYFVPRCSIPCDKLSAGMVGYLTVSTKSVWDTWVGDTVTHVESPTAEALPGCKKVTPMVCYDLYPADTMQYQDLRGALEKLQLNDASLTHKPGTLPALGFGSRCGFLRLLHLEIIQEKLRRKYDPDLVTTAPGVVHRVYKTDGAILELTNPSNLPNAAEIEYIEGLAVSAEIMLTHGFIGPIMQLCQERHGLYLSTDHIEQDCVILKYELPLNEIIYDFSDALRSRSRGYASLGHELKSYRPSKLVKLDTLINHETVDALLSIVLADSACERRRKMCEKLAKEIPHQLFDIPTQAAIGSKTVARGTIKAMRKDVLTECYGGDILRKKKLLEEQKEGKKRIRQIGSAEVSQKAFTNVLKLSNE